MKHIKYYVPPKININKLNAYINDINSRGYYTNSKYVRQLEDTIKDMYDVRYVVACSSCSQGLNIAVRTIHARECAIPNFTWYSTKYATESIKTSYIDVDIDTWLMQETCRDYELYIPVHTFGNTYKYNKEPCIYDAAHSLGAKIEDFGEMTVISLAPTKIITSCEGGLILTDYKKYYDKIISLRDKISRMSEIHAAIGLINIENINNIIKTRKKTYTYYKKSLYKYKFQSISYDFNFSTTAFIVDSLYEHNSICNLLRNHNIEYKQYYEPLDVNNTNYKNTNYLYNHIICVPSYDMDIAVKIVKHIRQLTDDLCFSY